MSTPVRVSALMALYNKEPFVEQAITSVLRQEFTNFELLIRDDGSTDNGPAIAREYAQKDSRIKFTANERNLNVPATMDLMLKDAQGEFIVVTDADDIFYPCLFQTMLGAFEKESDLGVVRCGAEAVGTRNKVFDIRDYALDDRRFREACLFDFPAPFSSMMFRASVLKKHGVKFGNRFTAAFDINFVLRLLVFTKARVLPPVMVRHRNMPNSHSGSALVVKEYVEATVANTVLMLSHCDINADPETLKVLLWPRDYSAATSAVRRCVRRVLSVKRIWGYRYRRAPLKVVNIVLGGYFRHVVAKRDGIFGKVFALVCEFGYMFVRHPYLTTAYFFGYPRRGVRRLLNA